MAHLGTLLFALCCLLVPWVHAGEGGELSASGQARNLAIELAPRPVSPSTLATRAEPLRLLVRSGAVVHFTRQSGRDYRLRAGNGLTWAQIEEIPRNAESLSLRPRLLEDGRIEVTVDLQRKREEEQRGFRSTLLLNPGEWQQLYGPVSTAPRDVRSYRTPESAEESLFLRVEPQP